MCPEVVSEKAAESTVTGIPEVSTVLTQVNCLYPGLVLKLKQKCSIPKQAHPTTINAHSMIFYYEARAWGAPNTMPITIAVNDPEQPDLKLYPEIYPYSQTKKIDLVKSVYDFL